MIAVDQVINLSGLRSLHYLTLNVNYVGVKEWERGFRVIDVLSNVSIAQSLKEITIGFSTYLDNFVDSDWKDIYDSKVWKELDPIISSMPALQRFHIHFDFKRDIIPPQFCVGVQASMPLVENRAILTLTAGPIGDLDRKVWSIGD